MKITDIIPITEAPLKDYVPLGKFDKPGPFKDPDYKLVTNPVHIKKVEKFFRNTPYDFRIFVSNLPGLRKHRESGAYSPENIKSMFGKNADVILQNSEGAINVIFLGNYGDERVPMTPWIMAHRIGHTIVREDYRMGKASWNEAEKFFFKTINSILFKFYGKQSPSYSSLPRKWDLTQEYNALFNAIGTQRSSRTNQIKRPYEFLYELFAQYINSGKITLNSLPQSLQYGRKAWGRPTKYMGIRDPELRGEETLINVTQSLSERLETYFAEVLEESVGKIFIM